MTQIHPTGTERRRAATGAAERVRRQLLILYVVGILVLSALAFEIHTADVNCAKTNTAATHFNAALDQLVRSAATAATLTPAQKFERIAKYRDLHLSTVKCPAL